MAILRGNLFSTDIDQVQVYKSGCHVLAGCRPLNAPSLKLPLSGGASSHLKGLFPHIDQYKSPLRVETTMTCSHF